MKKFAAILLGLIVIAAIVVLIGPSFVDWNSYKPQISAAVEAQTGRRLTIDGAIELQILPSPRLSVANVRLSNLAGTTEPEMVRLESLQVHVALQPLLTGTVQIASVTLIRPVISLERLADGTANWAFEETVDAGTSGSSAAASGSGIGGANAAVSLDGADIIDGTLIFRDGVTGQVHRFEDLDAKIAASSLNGPFSAEGSLIFQGLKSEFQVNLGKIASGRTAAAAVLDFPNAGGSVSFEGAMDLDDGPAIRGDLAIKAKDLGEFVKAVTTALGARAELPPAFAQALDVNAKIVATPKSAEVAALRVQLGDARLQGTVRATLGDITEIDATLSLGRLDLDKFGLLETGGSAAATAPAQAAAPPAGDADFTLPSDIKATVTLSADAVDIKGRTIRHLRLETRLDNGVVTVDGLTAQLPGGTDLTVTGTLYADAGLPRFIGRGDVVSDNLRTALDWLGVPLEDMAAGRLRKGVFGTDVDASPQQVQLSKWTVEIDNTSISGGLSLLLRDRPAFGLTLSIDKINLDAYLPVVKSDAKAGNQVASDGSAAMESTAKATALLSAFDANLLIQVGEATLHNTVIHEAALDATIQDGTVVIRDLSVKDFGGAALTVSGMLAGTVAQPRTDIKIMVKAKSAARLARLAGLEVTEPLKKLGGFTLESKVLGSLESLEIDAGLKMVGGRFHVKGVVEPLSSPPSLDLALNISHPKVQKLIGLLVAGFDEQGLNLGPGKLIGTIVTRPDLRMDVDTTLDVAASRLKLKGVVRPFADQPDVDATVSFEHPDIVRLIRFASRDFKPSRRDLGPLAVSFVAKGGAETIRLSDLKLTAGPAILVGAGTVALTGARPKVTFELAADTLDIDPWLPSAVAQPKGVVPAVPAKADGREWSRKRIDFTALQVADVTLEVTAKKVVYSSYIVDNAALSADLNGGKLTVHRLVGGLFGGRIDGAGRLVSTDTPTMEMSLKVEKADVRQAAVATANTGQVSGVLDYETALSSRGHSAFDLISALRGDGRFVVRDGAVEGIDLPAVSEQLKKLDRAVDFLVLAQRAMNGGTTPFESLTGSYVITDGVLRSDDVTLTSSVAAGRTSAVINLPPQEMDVQSRFWLAEHANSPPIGVRQVGPLSNPRTVLDVEKMQAYVLQRVVQRGILRQFGDVKKPDAAPLTPVQKEDPVPALPGLDSFKPKDALQGILKGLLK